MRTLSAVVALLVSGNAAHAGPLLDYIRSYDLNNYALGIMAGFHVADFDVRLTSSGGGGTDRSNGESPLPVVGVHAAVFLGEKTTVSGTAQIFRTDFDQYEGSLNYLALDIRYRWAESVSVGVGY